jgi:molybdenum cofactor biosynthesis enzyme MoaA
MMRFPLRLTADLALARIARRLRPAPGAHPVQFVDAAEVLHPDSSHPVSHEKIREIIGSRSPVVWIGGSEPLLHPGIAHLVRAITGSGHFVFLETDGSLLRRRIHEFQPVPRLFLTVRLETDAPHRASSGLQPAALELAVEGIRAARLSGFLICAQVRVAPETGMSDAAKLFHFAHSLDVDGCVISQARTESDSAKPDAEGSRQKTREARKLIGSAWWESFSCLIGPVVSGEGNAARSTEERAGAAVEQESHANEEGVKVA